MRQPRNWKKQVMLEVETTMTNKQLERLFKRPVDTGALPAGRAIKVKQVSVHAVQPASSG